MQKTPRMPLPLTQNPVLRRLDLLTRQETRPVRQARAHTRFVRRMRLALPLAAFAIIAVLFAWPQMGRNIAPVRPDTLDDAPIQGQNEVLNPRFESRDKDRQPYTITASRAVQNTENPDEVLLETPLGDLTLDSGKWVAVESRSGLFDQKKRFLRLQGNVRLYHDDGYELATDSVDIDLARQTAFAPARIVGQGPAGSIEAQGGLSADANSGKVILKGPVRLVLSRSLPGF